MIRELPLLGSVLRLVTVYSAASGSPHDAASICLVCIPWTRVVCLIYTPEGGSPEG